MINIFGNKLNLINEVFNHSWNPAGSYPFYAKNLSTNSKIKILSKKTGFGATRITFKINLKISDNLISDIFPLF